MKSYVLAGMVFAGSSLFGQTLQEAIRNTDNEQFSLADQQFRKLIASNPAEGANYYYLGENFYAQEEKDSAVVYWNKSAAKFNEEEARATALSLVAKGRVLWVNGKDAEAKEVFAQALKITKNKNADILRNIAKVYIVSDKKNLDEAITLLELAIKLDSKNEDGYILLGDAWNEKMPENGSNAIRYYNMVLENNPKSARGIVRTGKLYQRAKNYELANEKYKEAQRVDPNYAPSYRENAELNLKFNFAKEAVANWKKYLELNNSDEARYRYATSMFAGKQYCEVLPELNNLKTKGFESFYVDRMLAYSYAECTTEADAATKGLKAVDDLLQKAPADKIIYLDYKYKGTLLVNAGQDSLGLIEWERASQMNEVAKKELAVLLAKTYLKEKNYVKAIEYYEYKQTNGGLNAVENFELGRAYFFGPKNHVGADSAFTRLVEQSPTYVPGYFWKARNLFQMDLKNEKWLAKADYQKVVELVKPEERAQGNNKAMLMESCKYLGDYYTNSAEKDINKAREFWTIVQQLDPNDAQAKLFFTKFK